MDSNNVTPKKSSLKRRAEAELLDSDEGDEIEFVFTPEEQRTPSTSDIDISLTTPKKKSCLKKRNKPKPEENSGSIDFDFSSSSEEEQEHPYDSADELNSDHMAWIENKACADYRRLFSLGSKNPQNYRERKLELGNFAPPKKADARSARQRFRLCETHFRRLADLAWAGSVSAGKNGQFDLMRKSIFADAVREKYNQKNPDAAGNAQYKSHRSPAGSRRKTWNKLLFRSEEQSRDVSEEAFQDEESQ